jgi:hypothetical protein
MNRFPCSLLITGFATRLTQVDAPESPPLPQQTSSPILIPALVEFMLLMVTHVFMSSCFYFRVAMSGTISA